MSDDLIIIFDGVCNLCEASVNFVIRRDSRARFKFASAQSEAGLRLQRQYAIDAMAAGTMVLIKHGRVFTKSDAAVEIARELDGNWKRLSWIRILPASLRHWLYTLVARNRYRWFGKKDQCLVPASAHKNRFL